MGFSQLRRPQQSAFQSNARPQIAPAFGGPSANGMIGDALRGAGVLGTPSPAVKATRGAQPLPPFLDSPSEQQVSTDPKQNFQRSLNLQRGNEANSAKVFAENAPLPYASTSTPRANPPMVSQATVPGASPDSSDPVNLLNQVGAAPVSASEGFHSNAPAGMEYNGANGRGAAAEQTAQAARAALIARMATVANAQNFGAGQNYYANEAMRQDWNERENQDADTRADATPDAKTLLQQSQAAKNNAYVNSLVPSLVDKNKAGTDALNTKTGVLKDQAPLLSDKIESQTGLNKAREKGVETNTDTAARRETRIAGNPNPATVRATGDSVKDAVTLAKSEHHRLTTEAKGLSDSLGSMVGSGPTVTKMRAETQARLDAKNKEVAAAKQAWDQAVAEGAKQRGAAVKPSAGQVLGGPTTQPATNPHEVTGPYPANSRDPIQVRSREEAMALPSGTKFVDPDGVVRVRP